MKQFNRISPPAIYSLSKDEMAKLGCALKKHKITVRNTGAKALQSIENRINRTEI